MMKSQTMSKVLISLKYQLKNQIKDHTSSSIASEYELSFVMKSYKLNRLDLRNKTMI